MTEPSHPQEIPIPMDGFQQVLEMLRVAEAPFRDSLLKRIERQNAKLAQLLRKDLKRN
jgi:hypothetical protein